MTISLQTIKTATKKSFFLSICLALVVALLPACSTQQEGEVGAAAPDFTLPSIDGTSVSLADYKGEKPVLLYFHMAVG
jgi:cytochrome oxidase Cu insertion factor (SCO1/SenC/PrrC family)